MSRKPSGGNQHVKWAPVTPDGVAKFSHTMEAIKDKAEKVAGFKEVVLGVTLEAVVDWVANLSGQAIDGCPDYIVRTFAEIRNLKETWQLEKPADYAYWLEHALGPQRPSSLKRLNNRVKRKII